MPYKLGEVDEDKEKVFEFDLVEPGESATRTNTPVSKSKSKWSPRTATSGFTVPGNESDITMLPAYVKLMAPTEFDVDPDYRVDDAGNNQIALNITLTIDKDDYKEWQENNIKTNAEAHGRED